jgi:hypothetical protein
MPEDTAKISKRRRVWMGLTVLVLVGLWFAFRPEKLFVNKTVAEPPPTAAARLTALYTGTFHSNSHETTGRATVYQQPNGSRILTLSNFSTANAKAHVFLIDGSKAVEQKNVVLSDTDRDLGELKAAQGEQSYALPANIDFNRPIAVAIYSANARVIAGAATLDPF